MTPRQPSGVRRKVAVIGSGVSGLTAAFALHSSHDVTLFEADERLGGHAHTQDISDSSGGRLAIDTGFIVHNHASYPTLLRLFAALGVQTQPCEMSMSVHCQGCGLEYAGGKGGPGLIAQPSRLLRPEYLRLLASVPRFHRLARRLLSDTSDDNPTLGEFLIMANLDAYTVHHFVIPVVAAVWSCAPGDALRYPARYLFRFLANHGMLSISGSPQWYTVVGGSRHYVERAAKDLVAVHPGTPVRSVRRLGAQRGVEIKPKRVAIMASKDDHCLLDLLWRNRRGELQMSIVMVIATHPEQALSILSDATALEQAVLDAFEYTDNPTILHTSTAVLPSASRARASWNYTMPSCASSSQDVLVSYDMTRLQQLPTAETYVVTLNPKNAVEQGLVDPTTILREMNYAHPIFTAQSVAAQVILPKLNDGVTAFAGAYHGWGFHEDGARSGLAAARSLGALW